MSIPNVLPSEAQELSPLWAKARPLVLKTVIGSVLVAGLVAATAAIAGGLGEVQVKSLATILLVIVFALLTWFDAEVSTNRGNNFALVGVISSVFLVAAGLYKIWIQDFFAPEEIFYPFKVIEKFFELLLLLGILRLGLLIGSWLVGVMKEYSTPAIRLTAQATLIMITAVTLFFSLPVVFSHFNFGELYFRLEWAASILVAVGCVMVVLSVNFYGPKKPKPVYTQQQPYGQQYPPVGYPQQQGYPQEVQVPLGYNQEQPQPPAQGYYPNAGQQPAMPVNMPQNGTQGVSAPVPPTPVRKLAWPTYEDGTPLPMKADGSPDYGNVV